MKSKAQDVQQSPRKDRINLGEVVPGVVEEVIGRTGCKN